MNDKMWNVLTICAVIVTICVAASSIIEVATILLPPAEEAVPRAYQCEVYTEQGCAKYVVASGGTLEILSGGKLDVQSGAETDLSGGVDLDGALLDLDADGDTSIQADTDDQIDIEISAADDFQFTANMFEVLSGSAVKMNAGVLDLDADDDTSFTASTDDQIDVEISGADDFQFTANTFTALAGSTISLPATSDINAYGYVAVGDGTPDGSVAAGTDEELYVEGDFEVDGEAEFDGTVNMDAVMTGAADLEHLFFPTLASTAFTYTASAGGSIVLFTVADGEIWFVHDILINVTTNFDCTGNDCTVHIGDSGDEDGLCDLDDGELQTTDTEVTGIAAGWQCLGSTDVIGAYLANNRAMIYAPSGSTAVISATLAASGDDFAAGAATCYIVYTRIQ